MNLQEQISRIQSMMGLINEEQSQNTIVSGNYVATNCDELHAFQSTGGKVIGDMNGIVKNKIDELNANGINVKATNVSVKVNGMKVSWSVTLSSSNDNWVGFTSRGSGCNNNIEQRAGNDAIDNGPQNVINTVEQKIGPVDKIEVINDFTYNDPNGQNSFKQIFYRYKLKSSKSQGNQPIIINGSSLEDLRTKIKEKTKGISIDVDSIVLDKLSLKMNSGKTTFGGMSLIFDPNQDSLQKRYEEKILPQNPTAKILKQGKFEQYWWMLLGF
jgi:hypothetical protein